MQKADEATRPLFFHSSTIQLLPASPAQTTHKQKQDDRSDEGGDDGADNPAADGDSQRAEEPAADERSQNTDQDGSPQPASPGSAHHRFS